MPWPTTRRSVGGSGKVVGQVMMDGTSLTLSDNRKRAAVPGSVASPGRRKPRQSAISSEVTQGRREEWLVCRGSGNCAVAGVREGLRRGPAPSSKVCSGSSSQNQPCASHLARVQSCFKMCAANSMILPRTASLRFAGTTSDLTSSTSSRSSFSISISGFIRRASSAQILRAVFSSVTFTA